MAVQTANQAAADSLGVTLDRLEQMTEDEVLTQLGATPLTPVAPCGTVVGGNGAVLPYMSVVKLRGDLFRPATQADITASRYSAIARALTAMERSATTAEDKQRLREIASMLRDGRIDQQEILQEARDIGDKRRVPDVPRDDSDAPGAIVEALLNGYAAAGGQAGR